MSRQQFDQQKWRLTLLLFLLFEPILVCYSPSKPFPLLGKNATCTSSSPRILRLPGTSLIIFLHRRHLIQNVADWPLPHKMCRPLTVSCQRMTGYGDPICDHYLTLPNHKIRCSKPGTRECRAGLTDLMSFQNSPTQCAGKSDSSPFPFVRAQGVLILTQASQRVSIHRVKLVRGFARLL